MDDEDAAEDRAAHQEALVLDVGHDDQRLARRRRESPPDSASVDQEVLLEQAPAQVVGDLLPGRVLERARRPRLTRARRLPGVERHDPLALLGEDADDPIGAQRGPGECPRDLHRADSRSGLGRRVEPARGDLHRDLAEVRSGPSARPARPGMLRRRRDVHRSRATADQRALEHRVHDLRHSESQVSPRRELARPTVHYRLRSSGLRCSRSSRPGSRRSASRSAGAWR